MALYDAFKDEPREGVCVVVQLNDCLGPEANRLLIERYTLV